MNQVQFSLQEQLHPLNNTSHRSYASESVATIISVNERVPIDVAFSIAADAQMTAIETCRFLRKGCASRGCSANTGRFFACMYGFFHYRKEWTRVLEDCGRRRIDGKFARRETPLHLNQADCLSS